MIFFFIIKFYMGFMENVSVLCHLSVDLLNFQNKMFRIVAKT